MKCFDLLGFFFPPNKPFSRIDIFIQNLLVLSFLNFWFYIFFFFLNQALPALARVPCRQSCVLSGSSLVAFGEPSWVAVSPGGRNSSLWSRERHRSHAGAQPSPSCPAHSGTRWPRDSAATGRTQPRHPGRDEPGESRSPGPWQVREHSDAINSANCKGNV